MKIEVAKRGSKEYYDEFLYVSLKAKRFQNKPYRKAYQLTKYLMTYDFFVLLCMALFIVFYIEIKDLIYIFLLGMMLLIFIYSIMYTILINKRINSFRNQKGIITLEITSDSLNYISEEQEFHLKWSDIKNALINKYSICFLPIELSKPFISISTDYLEDVTETLKKYKYDYLIIDNTHLYKK